MAISLDSIRRGTQKDPTRTVLHGVPGIGKSTFAADAPNPIFITAEDGRGKIKAPAFPRADSFQDVLDAIGVLLGQETEFKSVVFDSISSIQDLVHTAVRAAQGADIFTKFNHGFRHSNVLFDHFFRGLDKLREARGMNIIVLAHTSIERHEPPDLPPYDRYEIGAHEDVADRLFKWADDVLFANYKTMTTAAGEKFGNKVFQGIGTGERSMFTQMRPTHVAKNRWSLPYEMPFKEGEAWAAYAAAVEAGRNS